MINNGGIIFIFELIHSNVKQLVLMKIIFMYFQKNTYYTQGPHISNNSPIHGFRLNLYYFIIIIDLKRRVDIL